MKRHEQDRASAIAAWCVSPEGRAAIMEAMERGTAKIAELREARRLDWKTLHEPVTI